MGTRTTGWILLLAVSAAAVAFGCVRDNRFDPTGCELHVEGTWTVDGMDPRRLEPGGDRCLCDPTCDPATDPGCSDLSDPEISRQCNTPTPTVCDPFPQADDRGIAEVRLVLFDRDDANDGGILEPWEDRSDLFLFDCDPCTEPRSPDIDVNGVAPLFLKTNSDEPGVRRTDRCSSQGQLLKRGNYSYRWLALSGTGQIIDCTPIGSVDIEPDATVIRFPAADFSQRDGANRCP